MSRLPNHWLPPRLPLKHEFCGKVSKAVVSTLVSTETLKSELSFIPDFPGINPDVLWDSVPMFYGQHSPCFMGLNSHVFRELITGFSGN